MAAPPVPKPKPLAISALMVAMLVLPMITSWLVTSNTCWPVRLGQAGHFEDHAGVLAGIIGRGKGNITSAEYYWSSRGVVAINDHISNPELSDATSARDIAGDGDVLRSRG